MARGYTPGRNLALNTRALDRGYGRANLYCSRLNAAQGLRTRDDGMAETVCTANWHGLGVGVNLLEPEVGDDMTFSASVYTTGGTASLSLYLMCYNASGTRVYPEMEIDGRAVSGANRTLVSAARLEEPERIASRITWSEALSALLEDGGRVVVTLQVSARRADGDAPVQVMMYAPKLEYGGEATPWRAAPEDLEGPSAVILGSGTVDLSAAVDIAAVYRYYLLQASTLSAPAVPTAKPPAGGWTLAEPSYDGTATNSLYTVELTVYSDGTYSYSAVSLSSSYEAAKAAWNKAHSAQTAASEASEAAETAQEAADTAQAATEALEAAVNNLVRVDAQGLHVVGYTLEGGARRETDGQVLIDSGGMRVVLNHESYSRFASNYVQFGNYQLRQTADGGLAFKLAMPAPDTQEAPELGEIGDDGEVDMA